MPKLPSKPWLVFLSSSAFFGTCIAYDKIKQKQIMQQLQDQVKHLAMEPLAPTDLPRKVQVYAAPHHYARFAFKTYVKPGNSLMVIS